MDAFMFFFILLLCLFMGIGGIFVPIIGFMGLLISVLVVVPQIPLLVADNSYMLFATIVVIACLVCPLAGYNRNE